MYGLHFTQDDADYLKYAVDAERQAYADSIGYRALPQKQLGPGDYRKGNKMLTLLGAQGGTREF